MRISDWSSDVCASDLPPYDSAATLARLGDTIARHAPERVIALGDSFHDGGAGARLADTERQRLRALTGGRDRSEARRVGKEGVRTCRYRLSPIHYKNKQFTPMNFCISNTTQSS